MTETVDDLGQVDWIVVEFDGQNFGEGTIAPYLLDYIDRGLIRMLDLLFIRKDENGELEFAELTDFGEGEMTELRALETGLAAVLSEQDVLDLAVTIDPGKSGALLVWENLWSAPFAAAVRHAGGQLVASGRIPTQAVLAAIEADDDDETDETAETAATEGV